MNALLKIVGAVSLVIIGGMSIGLGVAWGPELSARFLGNFSSPASAEMPTASASANTGASDEPLYWVAPMDPNYQRDGPGKSPMGMDLVPVYEKAGEDLPAGTVEISPTVINNLGVRTARVESGTLSDAIETVGYVAFDERQLEEVHARVAGWLRRLHVRADGERVGQFERLYDIYSPELISAQEEYLVALRAGDSLLIDASKDKLTSLGVSGGTIDRVRESLTVIPQVRVYAPQAGVIDSLSVGQGAYVTPGQRLLRIASMDPVWIEGEVFESQLAKLRTGAAVEIQADAVPGRRWSGTVDYIYPVLDSATRTARLRVVLENADSALLPNMFTRLTIAANATEPTLLVERDAVLRTGTMERVVLATGEGRFKSVEVKTGRRSRERVQILEGLESGDEVVISAQFLIDSESSISSDFRRMSEIEAPPESVWATGVVDEIYADEAIAAITHELVPEWDWPGMSMEFSLDETIDIEPLFAGRAIRFRMFKTDSGDYRIDAIEAAEGSEAIQ